MYNCNIKYNLEFFYNIKFPVAFRKGGSLFSECESRDWRNSLANDFFFQSSFEANKFFCLLNKLVLFTNQKQLLKRVGQNNYLDL